ncbi:MAG: SDR family NAD(P)-dependent oxidoreductase [Flavobacteriaceae bacterium]
MQPETRRVLITGAGSGIGRALAIEASVRGWTVALCGRRSAALEQTAALMRKEAVVLVMPADVTSPVSRARLSETVAASWGTLDILINNAGQVRAGRLADTPDHQLELLFATNVIAPMALTREFLPLLKAGTGGRVVNIGSVFGDIPYPNFTAYSATKSALSAFSSALRRECRHEGISVTHISPRATDTQAASVLEASDTGRQSKLDPPEVVAKLVWDAIDRGRKAAISKGPERYFVLLQNLFPHLIDRALSRSA